MPGELRKTLSEVVSAHAQNKRSRARFEFCLKEFVPEENTINICFSYVAMAKGAKLSRSDLDSSSGSDLSVSSRTSNRSLRVVEKERRKNEPGDPFLLALKYFSEGS